MKIPLLVAALAAAAPRPGASQIPRAENPARRLMVERPRLAARSAVTALRCCAMEQLLDLAVWWPQDPSESALGLGLVGGVATSGGDSYSRSGLALRLDRTTGRFELSGTLNVGLGTGNGPRSVLSMEVGGGLPSLQLNVRTTWFQDAPVDTLAPTSQVPGASTTVDQRYTEAELEARHRLGALGLTVTGGQLFGGDPRWTDQWLWAEADMPVHDRLSVVLSGGQRPDRRDLGQRGGRFAQIALRLNDRRPPRPPKPVEDESEALQVTRLADGRYVLRLRVPEAGTVELKGDVTDWEVLVMRRAGRRSDDWEAVLEKPAGLYHVNIRVDDGDWRVPAGLLAVPDGFGGQAGLLDLSTGEEANDGDA